MCVYILLRRFTNKNTFTEPQIQYTRFVRSAERGCCNFVVPVVFVIIPIYAHVISKHIKTKKKKKTSIERPHSHTSIHSRDTKKKNKSLSLSYNIRQNARAEENIQQRFAWEFKKTGKHTQNEFQLVYIREKSNIFRWTFNSITKISFKKKLFFHLFCNKLLHIFTWNCFEYTKPLQRDSKEFRKWRFYIQLYADLWKRNEIDNQIHKIIAFFVGEFNIFRNPYIFIISQIECSAFWDNDFYYIFFFWDFMHIRENKPVSFFVINHLCAVHSHVLS